MSGRSFGPPLMTSGLSNSVSADTLSPNVSSPAEQRDGAKRTFLKTMRAFPTQHYWKVYFSRPLGDKSNKSDDDYQVATEQLGTQIESVQDFWRYENNTPIDQIKMRESLYLFKANIQPVWEDERNLFGGSWTFRVAKSSAADFWRHIQMLAIGEKLQEALQEGDQITGVGLSVRFSSHLVSVWHRYAFKEESVENLKKMVLEDLPEELRPKDFFYKAHADHPAFKKPPNFDVLKASAIKRSEDAAAQAETDDTAGAPSIAAVLEGAKGDVAAGEDEPVGA